MARRPPLASLFVILVLPLALTGCGTKVFTHTVTIAVHDARTTLGSGPHEVSLFDAGMGQSEEWARRTIGTAAAGRPFTTTITSTAAVMAGDTGPRPRFDAGLYVPAIEPRGYFAIQLAPADGQTQETAAPFVPFYGFPADAPKPAPLVVRAAATAGDDGWRLDLVLQAPVR
jgi:hypothetical protein